MVEKFPDFTLQYPYGKASEGKPYFVTVGFVPKNFEALKKDDTFKVLMRQAYRYRSYKINRYRGGQFYVKELIALLEKELNGRK